MTLIVTKIEDLSNSQIYSEFLKRDENFIKKFQILNPL